MFISVVFHGGGVRKERMKQYTVLHDASHDCNPYTPLFVFPDTDLLVCGSRTRQHLGDAQCGY